MSDDQLRAKGVKVAVAAICKRGADWQDAQHALADHPEVGPWLEETFGADVLSEIQSIIREAEERAGIELAY